VTLLQYIQVALVRDGWRCFMWILAAKTASMCLSFANCNDVVLLTRGATDDVIAVSTVVGME
jgi:hypothetical protein